MIIEMILTALFNVFSVLTALINIPQLPEDVSSVMSSALQYVSSGITILGNWCHLDYLFILFGVIVAIDVGLAIYHFVMWVIKKIPMLNIS